MGAAIDSPQTGFTKIEMAHEFTEEQIEEFKDAFELFDRTGEGIIGYNQCCDVARCFGFNPTQFGVKLLLAGGDEENLPTKEDMENKSISFDDFMPILWGVASAADPGTFEDFMEGLKVFDKDGNGTVSSAELRHVMCALGEKLSPSEIDQLIEGLEDANGQVNYEAFIKKVMSDEEKVE